MEAPQSTTVARQASAKTLHHTTRRACGVAIMKTVSKVYAASTLTNQIAFSILVDTANDGDVYMQHQGSEHYPN